MPFHTISAACNALSLAMLTTGIQGLNVCHSMLQGQFDERERSTITEAFRGLSMTDLRDAMVR